MEAFSILLTNTLSIRLGISSNHYLKLNSIVMALQGTMLALAIKMKRAIMT